MNSPIQYTSNASAGALNTQEGGKAKRGKGKGSKGGKKKSSKKPSVEGRKLHTGPLGGKYYIKSGKKVYV